MTCHTRPGQIAPPPTHIFIFIIFWSGGRRPIAENGNFSLLWTDAQHNNVKIELKYWNAQLPTSFPFQTSKRSCYHVHQNSKCDHINVRHWPNKTLEIMRSLKTWKMDDDDDDNDNLIYMIMLNKTQRFQ